MSAPAPLPPAADESPVPLPAVLSLVSGFGLLIAYYRGRELLLGEWPPAWRLLLVLVGCLLLVGGLVELVVLVLWRSLWPGRAVPRLGLASWGGIILAATNVSVLMTGGPMPVPITLLLLAVGLGLIVLGVTRFADHSPTGGTRPSGGTRRGPSQRMALTRPGVFSLVIAIVLLAGAYLGPSNMLMLVFALIVGPFIVNGWFSFSMIRGLTLARTGPSQVMAGDPVSMTLTLTNRKRVMAGWLLIASDRLTHAAASGSSVAERLTAEAVFPRVPPRESAEAMYRVRLMRRGRYKLGPVRVRSRFPLGLVERSLVFALPGELLVAPRIGRLTDSWHAAAATDEPVQRRQPRRGLFQDEFEKLRSFRHGDNPRMIHWRTSGRLNALMVRQYQEVRDRDLLLLLDLTADPSDQAARATAELAISFAATVCLDHLRRSRNSGIMVAVAGREQSAWTGTASPAVIDPILGLLAIVEPVAAASLEPLWTFAHSHRTTGTAGILVTTRPQAVEVPPALGWLRTIGADADLSNYFVLT